jgi:hypothetical protein
VLHKVSAPSPPALGGVFTETIMFALLFGQGDTPFTVYVYAPGALVPGTKEPLNAPPPGAVQVPPAFGEPPSCANSGVMGDVEQSVIAPLVPAFGGDCSNTVTVLLALVHGGGTLSV